MLSIQSHDNDGRYEEWPIKEGGKLQGLKIFAPASLQVRQLCLFLWFLFFPFVSATIHMFISSFIIHYFLLRLTAGDGQMRPDTTVVEIPSIFTSMGWMMRPRCKAGLRQKREIQACCPLLGFPAENCTNGIITYTCADYLKHNLTEWFRLRGNMYSTQTQKMQKMCELSHPIARTGWEIVDKGNIYTAAQS